MNISKVVSLLFAIASFYSVGKCQEPLEIVKICESTEDILLDEASNTVCFNGLIDHSTPSLVKALPIDRKRPLRVVANSDGGIVNPSIDIAEYLGKYDIYVSRHCISACSQFLFMQAENKYVVHDGVVAIHGGPVPVKDIIDLDFTDEVKINLIRENLRFEQFYHERNINMDILINPPKHLHERLAAGEIVFWMPEKSEFERNGVQNIHYCNSKFGK
ncbi:hypothetical protein ACO1PK_04665 [Alishewanella sp. d11]|uniref:hypothetical protein n=1 Tax=Alishewanella sp. d11 TaxID=3414030 RepID=UPI003BF815D9